MGLEQLLHPWKVAPIGCTSTMISTLFGLGVIVELTDFFEKSNEKVAEGVCVGIYFGAMLSFLAFGIGSLQDAYIAYRGGLNHMERRGRSIQRVINRERKGISPCVQIGYRQAIREAKEREYIQSAKFSSLFL